MNITVKNLQQQTFTVEFDRERTVHELKEKIFKERGAEYVVEKQKLIYAGVILEDQRTIGSYNIDEKKFVVVMLKRDLLGTLVKPDETSTSTVKLGNNEETADCEMKSVAAKSVETKINATSKAASDEDTGSTPAATGTPIQSGGSEHSSSDLSGILSTTSLQNRAESNWLMGEEYNRTVESMVEMGYDRGMVERAMAASFNNPERAVEYLISGIPENEEGFAPMDTTGGDSSAAGGNINRTSDSQNRSIGDGGPETTPNSGENAPTDGTPSDDPFEFLRNQPQFVQMRSLVYQNPDLLHAVLQQIGQTNPALLQLISENQDAFLSMLNQPMAGQNVGSARRIPGRRAQLAAAATRATGAGRDLHNLVTAPGADGDDSIQSQRPTQTVDADPNITDAVIPTRPDSAVGDDNLERDRAVSALTAAVSAALERDAGGELNNAATQPRENVPTSGVNDGLGIISLTQQDRAAIDRLSSLGFPENLVLQAYFACDKDEELAANFLISSAFDD